ncbi:DUF3306 domain-containing protein [Skermanella mucosa]|uniref:DUF3306 domain-containing protein n=1 Tax=Skermanella mucosa TaxID=1789672 RepID=UPI00192B674C|nr:DUF3306 domain-containing protein [Skermanella mucosa]UEM21811.1 DUF3306 domain-containing protein [Skermanella mucosa]
MTSDREEGFLGRWARLKKRPTVSEPERAPDPVPAENAVQAAAQDTGPAAPEEPFDPASLPALDTLDAGSDYAAFLKPGVPRELRTLALRRAWVTDPAITGYKTLADYDWDFNAPGYGALRVTDDVADLARRAFGLLDPEEKSDPKPQPEVPQPEVPEPEIREPPDHPAESVPAIAEAPAQPTAPSGLPREAEPEPEPPAAERGGPRRRRHGGAVPTIA